MNEIKNVRITKDSIKTIAKLLYERFLFFAKLVAISCDGNRMLFNRLRQFREADFQKKTQRHY